jgi:hypothetical protein
MDGDLITVRLGGVDRQVFVTYWERHSGGEETIRLVGRILPNVIAGVGAASPVTEASDGTQFRRDSAPDDPKNQKRKRPLEM